jgi:uncharacterized coiled-coil protein SlyX
MSTAFPPPPQVSPDGYYYWDGEKWVPIQQQQQSASPAQAVNSTLTPAISDQAPPPIRRSSTSPLVRLIVEGLVGAVLVGLLVVSSDQWKQANQHLADQVAAQKASLDDQQSQIDTLQVEIKDLKERWFGSPALFVPPPIANTDFEFFDLTGNTQQELINGLNAVTICAPYGGCAPDPAVPNGVAWGLESFRPVNSTYNCYSPSSTTIPYREFVVLPRWSPPSDGSVKIPLVEAWNALAQVIYTHEAGHVAITQQYIAALNDQAHQQPSCAALISFWARPDLFDQLRADQDAYHARLHADCRPEVGCLPPGWMGW